MAGIGADVAKKGQHETLRTQTSAETTSKASADKPMDKHLATLRDLLKKMRIFYSEEEIEDDFRITREEVAGAIKAFNLHKKEWEEIQVKSTPIEERMLALEQVVKKSLADTARKASTLSVSGSPTQKTYASVVAPQMNRAAVRIRMEGAKEMQPTELLIKAKEHIKGAYAVRQLRSNDTEVFVQSTSQRDAALNMAQPKAFKILRHDFPVEVCGVPLRTKIEGGANANNISLLQDMCVAMKAKIPDLKINRIRWLHDGKEHERAKENGHTRGSIIISLPTENLQEQVVRHGIVLNAMLYTAQMWSPRAQVKQCFNCSQWGHTQASCGKAARCGECSGAHQTRDCPRKRVSCPNCGKEHRSWQKAACRTYQVYKGSVEKVRLELFDRTAEIWKERFSIQSPVQSMEIDDQDFTLVTDETTNAPKRRPGRPRKVVAAPETSTSKPMETRRKND